MALPHYRVIAKRGERDGKALWLDCGVAWTKVDKCSVKIDALPVGFDGWLQLVPYNDSRKPEGEDATASETKTDVPF